MDDLSDRLKKLGGTVSGASARLLDPGELAAARRMWLQTTPSSSFGARGGSQQRWTWRAGVLVAACLMVVVCVLVVRRPSPPISFSVGAPPARGTIGAWVAADRAARLPMRFSEGTSFVLAPGATVRVTETTAHGATLLLEQGDVSAEVLHAGAETRWSLQAGPFEVRVTGTRFDASWDPAGGTFDLAMKEGAVVVKGPLLQAGHELQAGERLHVSVRDGAMEVRTAGAAVPPRRGSADPVAVPPSATPDVSAPPASAAPSATVAAAPPAAKPAAEGAASPSWRDLSAAGKYNEALAVVERAGFAQEIERASSHDLAALADAARYASRPALAMQALLAQRRRFGVRGSSAFLLGKIAADQRGAVADAVRWFETYLQEEPNGALAEQALGRLLLLEKGDGTVAERYLARYPNGVHAPLARSLLRPTGENPKPPSSP
jgi:hypothetical protein